MANEVVYTARPFLFDFDMGNEFYSRVLARRKSD